MNIFRIEQRPTSTAERMAKPLRAEIIPSPWKNQASPRSPSVQRNSKKMFVHVRISLRQIISLLTLELRFTHWTSEGTQKTLSSNRKRKNIFVRVILVLRFQDVMIYEYSEIIKSSHSVVCRLTPSRRKKGKLWKFINLNKVLYLWFLTTRCTSILNLTMYRTEFLICFYFIAKIRRQSLFFFAHLYM